VCRLRDKNILLLRNMEIRYREVRLMRFDTTDISTSIKIAFRRIPATIMSYIHYFHTKKLYALFFLSIICHADTSRDSIKVVGNYVDYYRDHKTIGVPSIYIIT